MKMDKQVFYHRCPGCHRIIDEDQLFGIGCPICGWTSPIKKRMNLSLDKRIKEREPLTDFFDEGNCLRLTFELPGVDEESIKMSIDSKNHLLILLADASNFTYHKRVDLPPNPIGHVKTSFKNGVFEIRMMKDVSQYR